MAFGQTQLESKGLLFLSFSFFFNPWILSRREFILVENLRSNVDRCPLALKTEINIKVKSALAATGQICILRKVRILDIYNMKQHDCQTNPLNGNDALMATEEK